MQHLASNLVSLPVAGLGQALHNDRCMENPSYPATGKRRFTDAEEDEIHERRKTELPEILAGIYGCRLNTIENACKRVEARRAKQRETGQESCETRPAEPDRNGLTKTVQTLPENSTETNNQ